jgi:hypothetical protein
MSEKKDGSDGRVPPARTTASPVLGRLLKPEQIMEQWQIDRVKYDELRRRGLPAVVWEDGTVRHHEGQVDDWFRQGRFESARAASLRRLGDDLLNATESLIVTTLGSEELKGEAIARRAKVPYSSNVRTTLASLVKRGILGKGRNGYHIK